MKDALLVLDLLEKQGIKMCIFFGFERHARSTTLVIVRRIRGCGTCGLCSPSRTSSVRSPPSVLAEGVAGTSLLHLVYLGAIRPYKARPELCVAVLLGLLQFAISGAVVGVLTSATPSSLDTASTALGWLQVAFDGATYAALALITAAAVRDVYREKSRKRARKAATDDDGDAPVLHVMMQTSPSQAPPPPPVRLDNPLAAAT